MWQPRTQAEYSARRVGSSRAARTYVLSSVLVAAALGAACSSPGPADDARDASSPASDANDPALSNEPSVDASQPTSDDAQPDAQLVDAGDAGVDADATIAPRDSAPSDDGGEDAEDAPASDAPLDAPGLDGGVDAAFDAADSAPDVCGDGVRAPATEECDNGAANVDVTGACSTTCQVQDFLASSTLSATDAGPLQPFQYPPHTLGQGRHPIAAGAGGFAISFLEQAASGSYTLRAEAFDPGGVRVASFPIIGTPGPAIANADPVLVAISATQYVALWGDTGAGAVGPGVAMAILDTGSGNVGAVAHANASTESPESAPDALWIGGSLVVAWVDGSNANTDIEVATFDATLKPTNAETYLARTSADELDVSLAPFNGTWAAAWRASENGQETVHVRSGSTEVATSPAWGGIAGERPALVQVGPTTLFVAYSVTIPTDDAGDTTTTVLQGAIVDLSGTGTLVSAGPRTLDAQGDGGDSRFPEGSPAAVVQGGELLFGAWTGAQTGDPLGDEVWLASSPSSSAASVGTSVLPLPRWEAHRAGDQRNPALGVTTLAPNGALVGVWEDYGASVSGLEARPDVVVEVAPQPMLR